MSKRRVVVTGLGMVSALGNNVNDTWQGLINGKSGVNLIENFNTTTFATKFAAQVKNFEVDNYLSPKEQRKTDVFIQYGLAAGMEAILDSGIDLAKEDLTKFGVAAGSGIGGLTLIEENAKNLLNNGPRKLSPFFVPSTIVNMLPGQLSIKYGLQGPSLSVVTACTTGVHNIGQAMRMISYGDAEIMLAGGAEKASTPLGIGGFGAAKALSTNNENPTKASRPWDLSRDGFVLGDGAGMLVLEEYQHAIDRGARIYAEIVGFGMSSDAYHMTSPPADGNGAKRSMLNALKDANITADVVGYINAHGTSTKAGDMAEAVAIQEIFKGNIKQIKVSSTKSMTGHLLGAAGAIESIFTILALYNQIAPPTINLDEPEPEIVFDLVANTAQKLNTIFALNNSFGFGGTNGSLVFKKF